MVDLLFAETLVIVCSMREFHSLCSLLHIVAVSDIVSQFSCVCRFGSFIFQGLGTRQSYEAIV